MFLNQIERNNTLYEVKDYDLSALQVAENTGKIIAVNGEALEVVDLPVVKEEVVGVAEVDGVVYATLAEAFNAVTTSGEVKLVDDVILSDTLVLPVGINVTLNLNNHSVRAALDAKIASCMLAVPNGTTLTVDGCGTIYGAAKAAGAVYGAIQLTTKATYNVDAIAKLVINNGNIFGDYYAIAGNGGRHNTEVEINGGYIANLHTAGSAIFNPQNGKVTINRGTIVGINGIEMRAGDLTVNGGLIESTTAPTEVNANGSGTTTVGSAVAVAQHNTKLPINVVVNSGVLKGYHALHQANPQKNEEEAVALVNMFVNDGTFIATNGGNIPVYSENKEKFVTGGTFVPAIEEKYMA